MKLVLLISLGFFLSISNTSAMQPARLAELLGPVIVEAKVRAEGHHYDGVDVAMKDYLAESPTLKGYDPRIARVDDGSIIGFKIMLSNVPEVECKSFFSFPEVYRRLVVNGRDAVSGDKACSDTNEVEAYPFP